MSTVVVVGVDHSLQNLESFCRTTEDKESKNQQREALKDRLQELIIANRVELVAEEARPDSPCLGKLLADSHACRYCDLTMPHRERERRGIKQDYNKAAETQKVAYGILEGFMFEVVQENRQEAKSILIICGSRHAKNVAQLFLTAGDEVIVEDTTSAPWYQARWPFLRSMHTY